MSKTQEFSHFIIKHQLQRRIRIIVPSLFRDKERATILQIVLLKRAAIEEVSCVWQINSLTIYFDPEQLPKENLFKLLETVLANFSKKPHASISKFSAHHKHPDGPKQDVVFGIGGMSCASCALFLEMVLSRNLNNQHVSINYISETGNVSGYLTKEEIFKIVHDSGYQAYSIDTLAERKLLLKFSHNHLLSTKKRLLIITLLDVPVLLASLFFKTSKRMRLIQALFSFPVVFLGGGGEIFKKSWIQAKQGTLNMDTLVAIGAGSAYMVSIPALFNVRKHAYFEAATAIIGFVQVGRYLEELAKSKMVHDVEELVNMQPQNATLLEGRIESIISIDKIAIDNVLLIRPGERIPVDGIVLSGLSSVDESMVTGANAPCIKEKGHKLFDGSINGSGVLRMQATAIGKDTVLAGLVHMIDQTQSSKLQIQKTVDIISSHLTPAIMFLSVLTFGGWVIRGEAVAHAFANAISVLLISCPCALGLATPAATSVSSGQAAKRKIYIRNGNALEQMAVIDTIIFDKTGTLTEGHAKVVGYLNISDLQDDYLLQLAASVEFNSEHLLGKAVVEYVRSLDLPLFQATKFHSIPDQGVRAEVNGHGIMLGNESWLQQQKIDMSVVQDTAANWAKQGNNLIYLVVDNKLAALLSLTDQIRKGARQLMIDLHKQGIETLMLTGDTKASAQVVADLAGIESVTANASPARKIQFIRDLQTRGRVVAMVGDGINDAPALAAANVSLVVGNATGIAIETADYILVDSDISKVAEVLDLSKQTLTVVQQNLFWAFAYNAIAIPVAMTGKLSPMISSAAMALSSVSVIANSLRLNKK
ncbi:heavy metal translocating P-type ATPase [Methyloprofundus sedimenti]|nr:heavy metal translocating P-type ATPase [Methyloprofundus sedimenti]